ncbi:DUF6188 family protein [Nocardia nova]
MNLKRAGQAISDVLVGFMVTVRIGESSEFELQIEGDIELRLGSGPVYRVDSENYEKRRKEIESLVGAVVVSARADESGALTLELDSGTSLRVPPDDDYEAWSIAGPGGYRVVSLPGGELAVWSATRPD